MSGEDGFVGDLWRACWTGNVVICFGSLEWRRRFVVGLRAVFWEVKSFRSFVSRFLAQPTNNPSKHLVIPMSHQNRTNLSFNQTQKAAALFAKQLLIPMPFNASIIIYKTTHWVKGVRPEECTWQMVIFPPLQSHSIVVCTTWKRETFLIIIIIITFTFNPEAIKQRRNPIKLLLKLRSSRVLCSVEKTTAQQGKKERDNK
jgi:hypothetical protein